MSGKELARRHHSPPFRLEHQDSEDLAIASRKLEIVSFRANDRSWNCRGRLSRQRRAVQQHSCASETPGYKRPGLETPHQVV
jgi:hypothetical protein